ncbi:Fanconi anemia core complex-associated protein 100 [Cololabis saira]|uniref:Fanconi anemia core complex-associated protein 100 n=1 Tax=Cololabis saira TaxID=129043 RepID=UPI002AD47984|nr:Fanconi anemia core complex-associated protein 100 [Cololabis saira]
MTGVYCVDLQSLLHRAHNSSDDTSSGPAELKISSEFLIVGAHQVSSLLLVGSVLLTLCQTDAAWLLTLYKTPQQAQHRYYEVLGSFSLPLVSPALQGSADSNTGLTKRPVLVCVHSGDTTTTPPSSLAASDATLSPAHFHLEPVLFKLLFGVDAALAKSPVILCGLPDGRLCFLPLHVPASRLRVLHSLEQPVVFVGASVATETNPGFAQCLLAVGKRGRVVLIKTEKGRAEGESSFAGFTEGCVAGPVECSIVDKNCLYYSTGSDLLILNLLDESPGKDGDEKATRTTAAALQSPTSLNVCGVIALAEPTCNAAGEVQLLGLSARGQLSQINLPVGRRDSGSLQIPSSNVGRSVRDLLSAIGDVCERASVLRTLIKSKNQILRQLNQVVNISFLLKATTNAAEHLPTKDQPIRCHATASWSRLLQKNSLNLACVLDNSSPYILERGWTLSITVSPLSCSSSAREETSSTNFSFPFHNLHPGDTTEVTVPIAAAGDASFPMTVTCSLIFSLSSLLGEEEVANISDFQSRCFSFPLNALTVDWLHTLQAISPRASHNTPTSPPAVMEMDAVRAFLSSRLINCGGGMDRRGESASKPEKYSASVRVSSQLLRDTLRLNSESAPRDLSCSLLNWLLSEDHGGVKMRCKAETIDSSVVHALAANEVRVKLTAKEMNVESEHLKKAESLVSIDVQMESSSIAAVCGLHHAVLCRIQKLLLRAPEKAASTKRVCSLSLRSALQRAELQQSQISEAFSLGMSSGQMKRCLLSIYRELRESPLLIL